VIVFSAKAVGVSTEVTFIVVSPSDTPVTIMRPLPSIFIVATEGVDD